MPHKFCACCLFEEQKGLEEERCARVALEVLDKVADTKKIHVCKLALNLTKCVWDVKLHDDDSLTNLCCAQKAVDALVQKSDLTEDAEAEFAVWKEKAFANSCGPLADQSRADPAEECRHG